MDNKPDLWVEIGPFGRAIAVLAIIGGCFFAWWMIIQVVLLCWFFFDTLLG